MRLAPLTVPMVLLMARQRPFKKTGLE